MKRKIFVPFGLHVLFGVTKIIENYPLLQNTWLSTGRLNIVALV